MPGAVTHRGISGVFLIVPYSESVLLSVKIPVRSNRERPSRGNPRDMVEFPYRKVDY